MADSLSMKKETSNIALIQYRVQIQVLGRKGSPHMMDCDSDSVGGDDGGSVDGCVGLEATATGGPSPLVGRSLLKHRILNTCQRDLEHPLVSLPIDTYV
jgi:hypothetical protein